MALPATLRVEQLSSGEVYGYVLPNIMRMRYSGFFPSAILGVIDEWLNDQKSFGERQLSEEEALAWEEARARLVAWMVRTTGGVLEAREDPDGKAELDYTTFPPRPSVKVVSLGDAATLDWEQVVDPESFPMDDFTDLFARAIRAVAAPKAVSMNGGRGG